MELQLWNSRTWNPFGLQIHKMCPRVALSFSYNIMPHIFKFHPHISSRPQTVSLPPKQPLSGQNVYKEVPCKKSRLSRTNLRHGFLANIIIYTSGKFHSNPWLNNSSMDVPFLQLNSKLKGFNFIKEKIGHKIALCTHLMGVLPWTLELTLLIDIAPGMWDDLSTINCSI